jgi:SM-20-related protein
MGTIFETVIDALSASGCYVGASILDEALTEKLHTRAQRLHDDNALQASRIGRLTQTSLAETVRSDRTRWLDDTPSDIAERDAMNVVNDFRRAINEALFIGAGTTELHFAHYAPGAFYRTHRDQFADNDARLVSLVFYLNRHWQESAGGELVIYDPAMQPLCRVTPQAGTMVAFMSERFPHEVLPASRDRFSLTGWLRRTNAVGE